MQQMHRECMTFLLENEVDKKQKQMLFHIFDIKRNKRDKCTSVLVVKTTPSK